LIQGDCENASDNKCEKLASCISQIPIAKQSAPLTFEHTFGRHVADRSGVTRQSIFAILFGLCRIKLYRQTKVKDFDVTTNVKAYIVGFQIPINNAVAMKTIQCKQVQ
jgi:hypothetical protein